MKERRNPRTVNHEARWTEAEREAYRHERADTEEKRRAAGAKMSLEAFRKQQRENERAHGELTRRFLESKGAKDD